jgi:arginase
MHSAVRTLAPVLLLLACTGPSLEGPTIVDPHRYRSSEGSLRIALVKQPYHGGRNVPELSRNPDYLEEGGIADLLAEAGHQVSPVRTVALTGEESREYGEWHRMGLANGHLADVVAENERNGIFTLGLLGNCNALMGMLGGFQRSDPSGEPLRIALVWIDAHGDFNTPETTLSGMLGGMPVAVSAGLALHRLRKESHLDPPILTENILMVAVRDTDPEEEELIQAHGLARITTRDVRERSPALHEQMARLSSMADLIYVHVDMDVLDPREVQGHGLTVENGPTSQELAAALEEMFRYPRVAGLGIASTPAYEADPGELSRQAAYRLIDGAVAGVMARERGESPGQIAWR